MAVAGERRADSVSEVDASERVPHWRLLADSGPRAKGGVIWPHENGKAKAVEPHGIQHYYALLAIVSFDSNGVV